MTAPAAVLLLAASACAAQPAPGVYESSRGSLEIKTAAGGAIRFHLIAVSASGDLCELGDAPAARTRPAHYLFDDEEGCRIDFDFSAASAVAARASDGCTTYCGVSAVPGGEFRLRPRECAARALAAARARFQGAFGAGRYAAAASGFERLVGACAFFMPVDELAADRADLSTAFLKTGALKKCREQVAAARREYPALEASNLGNLESRPALERLEQLSKALSLNERKCAQSSAPR